MSPWTPSIPEEGSPRYIAIADAIARDIDSGALWPGERLPPQRRLAEALGIDFTTVSRGYAEARRRGLVESHVGRGTFVCAQRTKAPSVDPARLRDEDLAMNMPPDPDDERLLRRMREGLDYVGVNMVHLLRYQSPVGSERDKSAAMGWLGQRGVSPASDRVAVTPGAHATILAILTTLSAPGDTILCEAISYPGLRTIAARLCLNLQGVPMDEDGIDPEALAEAVRTHRPKALYLTPTLHNPTTLTVPTSRRQQIAQVAVAHGLPVIEDDAYGFVPPDAPAALAAHAPEQTWYIGGLSKCLGAGLRLAYTLAPSSRCALSLGHALRSTSVMASPISAALATRWIEDGTAGALRDHIRSEAASRQAIAAEMLAGLDYKSAPNAFNVWLRLPEGTGRADLMGRMAGRHIGIMPSDAFTVLGEADEHVRVCLGGSISREDLRRGLLVMTDSLQSHARVG